MSVARLTLSNYSSTSARHRIDAAAGDGSHTVPYTCNNRPTVQRPRRGDLRPATCDLCSLAPVDEQSKDHVTVTYMLAHVTSVYLHGRCLPHLSTDRTLTLICGRTTDWMTEALLLWDLVCRTVFPLVYDRWLAVDSLGDIWKLFYLAYEKLQCSVMSDVLCYITILTYLLAAVDKKWLQSCHLWLRMPFNSMTLVTAVFESRFC